MWAAAAAAAHNTLAVAIAIALAARPPVATQPDATKFIARGYK